MFSTIKRCLGLSGLIHCVMFSCSRFVYSHHEIQQLIFRTQFLEKATSDDSEGNDQRQLLKKTRESWERILRLKAHGLDEAKKLSLTYGTQSNEVADQLGKLTSFEGPSTRIFSTLYNNAEIGIAVALVANTAAMLFSNPLGWQSSVAFHAANSVAAASTLGVLLADSTRLRGNVAAGSRHPDFQKAFNALMNDGGGALDEFSSRASFWGWTPDQVLASFFPLPISSPPFC